MLFRNIVLILIMLSILPLGLFLMRRLDRFLDAGKGSEEETQARDGPARIFLSEKSTDEEILKEIDRFRKEHKHVSIIISEEEKE